MEDLIHVIYLGAVAPDMAEHYTVEFLKEARKANRQNDVSGMMLYVGGCIVLMLEGEYAQIDRAANGMSLAKREMRLILREPVAEREFPDWIMGFETVEPLEAAHLLGEPLPLDSMSRIAHIGPDGIKTLLSIIGRRRWQSDRSGMFRAIRRRNSKTAAG